VDGWFLINSKPRQELVAEQSLRRLGVETLFPRVKEEKTIRRRKQIVVGPLFPGYLFARFEVASRYRAVSFANGVKRIVAFGSRLAVVDQATVDSITERMHDGCITIARPPLSPGESVRITGGPLEGWEAVLERELAAQDRVVLLFKRLSYQVRVVVDLDRVANL
jgi:transcriptional antiterminator RfaH